MVSFLNTKRPGRPLKRQQKTSVSFSAHDLAELGHALAVGGAVLQKHPPVVVRLKAAMTRIGVSVPRGL